MPFQRPLSNLMSRKLLGRYGNYSKLSIFRCLNFRIVHFYLCAMPCFLFDAAALQTIPCACVSLGFRRRFGQPGEWAHHILHPERGPH